MQLGPVIVDVAGLSLTAEEKVFLKHPQIGGVILFSRNYESPEQLQRLVKEIKQLRDPQLLVSVDQEGGRVQRFTKGFIQLPSLGTIGELYQRDPSTALEAAHSSAWVMATELLSYGIDLSFAPVLDLNRELNEVIANRSFHHDPNVVIILAKAYIKGMRAAGMHAVGKHFPGHGAVTADTHDNVATDNRPLPTIMAEDMQPFAELSKQQLLSGMMTAHIIYPAMDDVPATFSQPWLQKILRQHIGFNGVIFSDDLNMAGAQEQGDYVSRANMAIEAGCDKILICNNPDAASDIVDNLTATVSDEYDISLYGEQLLSQQALSSDNRWHQAVDLVECLVQPSAEQL